MRGFIAPDGLGVQFRSISEARGQATSWLTFDEKARIHHVCHESRPNAEFLTIVSLVTTLSWSRAQPQISNLDRGRAQDMLRTIAGEVRKHYYDPKFHGVDWDAKVAEAKEKIAKTTSMNMALSHIAAALDTLNDSHTFFLPAQHAYRHEYGLEYQMVGDRCFVSQVRPRSDAEAKGVKPGDEILTINSYNLNRDDLLRVQYVFSILRPQPVLQLVLQNPGGTQRQVEVEAKIRETTIIADLRLETEESISMIW